MYTINAIFEDIENTSCAKVYVKVYDNTDNVIAKGYINTSEMTDFLANKPLHIHSGGCCGIQIDTVFPVQDYVGKEIARLIKSFK